MAFGLDCELFHYEKELKGKQIDIACKCWFSRSGRSIPLMIKFEDENGEIQTIDHIAVYGSEESRYCGITSVVHNCAITCRGKIIHVKIVHHRETDQWTMMTE